MQRSKALIISTTALVLMGITAAGTGSAVAHEPASGKEKHVSLSATLSELNGSGASGSATAVVKNQKIESISVDAHGLTPDAPHAQHIHYGNDARNECPSLFQDDANGDGVLNTVEGVPAYGPVVVSLTTTGDTTPASLLAVDRFPVSADGSFSYSRTGIEFTDVAGTGYTGGGTAKQIADSIREGEGVVVIHGIDYNGNGVYDFEGRGASELDPSLPAEATDPAVCGILN